MFFTDSLDHPKTSGIDSGLSFKEMAALAWRFSGDWSDLEPFFFFPNNQWGVAARSYELSFPTIRELLADLTGNAHHCSQFPLRISPQKNIFRHIQAYSEYPETKIN